MKKSDGQVVPKTISAYLAALPEKERLVLGKLRKTIRAAAPKAEETISYQMPAFKHHGMLVFFAAFSDHCSFFPGPSAIREFAAELKGYDTDKGTIRFSIDRPLPATLVKKIVQARVKENDAKLLARKKRKQ